MASLAQNPPFVDASHLPDSQRPGLHLRRRGMERYAIHYLDLADARVGLSALARGEPGFSYREYKGSPHSAGRPESRGLSATSRVLSIAAKEDNVYIELKSGPGKLTPTGAVTPNGRPLVEVNVGCKRYEAQRLAAAVLAYIQAWDVHRMMVHQQLVGRPAPFQLVAVGSLVSSVSGAMNGGAHTGSVPGGQATASGHGREPAAKTPRPRTKGSRRAESPQATLAATAEAIYGPGPLRYGDGTAVDPGNPEEVDAFGRFAAEKEGAPASKRVLQAYYRERLAA